MKLKLIALLVVGLMAIKMMKMHMMHGSCCWKK